MATRLTSWRRSRQVDRALGNVLLSALAFDDVHLDAGRRADLEQLVQDVDCAALPAAARAHRLSGTVGRALSTLPSMPSAVLSEIRHDAELAAVHGMVHLAVLKQVSEAFDHSGIRWLAMKGPVLSQHYYSRAADRSFRDLDLLVDRRDFGSASDILEGLGFRHVIRNWSLASEMLAGEIELVSSSAFIDLHWHLSYSNFSRRRIALEPDELLSRRRPVDLSGLIVPTFDAEDTVVTLAYHAARTGGHRLVWLKDLERAICVDAPDLDTVVRRAREAGVGPQVGLMLERTRAVTQADIPSGVIDALVPASVRMLERTTCSLSDPVRLDDRMTLYRFMMRSIGTSTANTLAHLPSRAATRARRMLRPPAANETDDPDEKQQFFRAVAEVP